MVKNIKIDKTTKANPALIGVNRRDEVRQCDILSPKQPIFVTHFNFKPLFVTILLCFSHYFRSVPEEGFFSLLDTGFKSSFNLNLP